MRKMCKIKRAVAVVLFYALIQAAAVFIPKLSKPQALSGAKGFERTARTRTWNVRKCKRTIEVKCCMPKPRWAPIKTTTNKGNKIAMAIVLRGKKGSGTSLVQPSASRLMGNAQENSQLVSNRTAGSAYIAHLSGYQPSWFRGVHAPVRKDSS